MSKFNPLYILLFSFCLFIYSMIVLNKTTTKLTQARLLNKQYIQNGQQYCVLQKAWGKQNNTKDKLDKILQSSNIKNAHIITNDKTIKIKIINANLKSLDKFINKILNETITIINLSLTKSTLELEIGK